MVQIMGPAGPGSRKTRESWRETDKNKNKENDLAKRKVAATQAKLKQNPSKTQTKSKQNSSKAQAKLKQSKTQRQGRSPSTKLRVRLRCNQSWPASPTGRAERWPASRASSAASVVVTRTACHDANVHFHVNQSPVRLSMQAPLDHLSN